MGGGILLVVCFVKDKTMWPFLNVTCVVISISSRQKQQPVAA